MITVTDTEKWVTVHSKLGTYLLPAPKSCNFLVHQIKVNIFIPTSGRQVKTRSEE